MSEFGWPSAARLEFGTLDGIIGCVAADMGVTLLPRAVAERSELSGGEHRRVDTDQPLTSCCGSSEDRKNDEPALVSAVDGAGSAMLFSVAAAI
jgi:DNA-binding transcriptional LysR family regulator